MEFANAKTVGPEGDFPNLITAIAEAGDTDALGLVDIVHEFTEPIVISRKIAIGPAEDKMVTLKAPKIIFDVPPSKLIVVSCLDIDAHIEIRGGSTISFEDCRFTCSQEAESIMEVHDSTPTIRNSTFYNFPGYGIIYNGSKGGILTDNVFDKIGKEPILKNEGTKPYHEHNTVK